MTPETDIILLEPRPGLERIHNEFCKLVEDRTMGQPYQGGAYLTPSDIATMKIVFNLNAKTGFWAPAGDNRKCALEEILNDLETMLNDKKLYKKELAECQCPKILDAYGPSVEYSRILQYLVKEGLFYNEAFIDASGDDQFHNLRCVPVASFVLCVKGLHELIASPTTEATYTWRPVSCSARPAIHISPSFPSNLSEHHRQRSFCVQNSGHCITGRISLHDVGFIRPNFACR